MKILFVLENYYPSVGGVETLFELLSTGLAESNQVTVLTSRPNNARIHEVYKNVKIVRVSTPSFGRRYWFTLCAILPAIKLTREFDVVHTTTYNGAVPAFIASLIQRKPSVITVHEVLGSLWFRLDMNWLLATLHYIYEFFILTLPFGFFVCDSNSTCDDLKKISLYKRRIKRIYAGINLDEFKHPRKIHNANIWNELKIYDSRPKMLFFGRPGWVKGVQDLVSWYAGSEALKTKYCLVLLLSSEPRSQREKIVELIQALHLTDSIYVRQSLPKVRLKATIAAADLVVVPSKSEGFGYSAAEAALLGSPVLARNTKSLPELLPKENLFRDRDEFLKKVMKKVPQIDLKRFKAFAKQRMVNEYYALYRTL